MLGYRKFRYVYIGFDPDDELEHLKHATVYNETDRLAS